MASEKLERAIESGVLKMYLDSDPGLVREAEIYNRRAADCRVSKKRLAELEFGFFLLNPLAVLALLVTSSSAFRRPVLAAAVLIVFVLVFVIFAVARRELLAGTAAVVLLLTLDWKFCILLAGDIVLWLIHRNTASGLTEERGYPDFQEITVIYEDWYEPKNDK